MEVPAYLISYGLEWLNLIVRWLHLIAGVAWIGASFYFIWLDNTIKPPKAGSDLAEKGVSGELWAVHGGGFYNPQKYLIAPKQLPEELHWFKWEAYTTWLSGFALLFIVYYFNAQAMMIDKSVADISSWQAVAIGLGALSIGWIVYDLLCRSPLGRRDMLFGIVMFAFVVGSAYVLSRLFSGRAAYIHVGAMIGTIMAGNVLMSIIPGQRKLVGAMMAGKIPDPGPGKTAKQRSVHNNYFTLPVLFIMISNHAPMTYSHRYSWLVLAAIIAAGVSIRHFFNLKHKGRIVWRYPVVGAVLLLIVAVAIAPLSPVKQKENGTSSSSASKFIRVQEIVSLRCVACHSDRPTQPGFSAAPVGVMLHRAELIHQNAAGIYRQAVQLKTMPIANLTKITDEERAILGAWFEGGAK